MSTWPHQVIFSGAVRYIRRHAMDIEKWRYTLIAASHAQVSRLVQLSDGEQVVVSCFISDDRWYQMTTARFVGSYRGASFDASPLTVQRWEWGDFKSRAEPQIGRASATLKDNRVVAFAYETGAASMAPIYYERFWHVKYPIVDKLAV